MTFSIYLYIQRGLFERHKLTFALMLTNKIQVSAKALSLDLVNVFLKGGGSLDPKSVKKKPHAWIPDKCWLDLVAMSQHKSFADIVESINVNEKLVRQGSAGSGAGSRFRRLVFFCAFPKSGGTLFLPPLFDVRGRH
jgi:dynein heavy chain